MIRWVSIAEEGLPPDNARRVVLLEQDAHRHQRLGIASPGHSSGVPGETFWISPDGSSFGHQVYPTHWLDGLEFPGDTS